MKSKWHCACPTWLQRVRERGTRIAPLSWLLVAACVTPSATPPAVSPTSTLRPALAVEGERSNSPFALAFAGPRGPAPTNAQINLVFNRPLRALDAEQRPPQLPIAVAPTMSGAWQWVGSHAVAFVPTGGHFPPATRVEVTVPASLSAITGETLGKASQWTFETPLPRVEHSQPTNDQEGVRLREPIVLTFNQPVAPSELQRLATLSAGKGANARRLAFTAQRPKQDKPNEVVLIPQAPLPKGSQIEVHIPDGLRGEGGPLPSTSDFQLDFSTYGPMRVTKSSCGEDAHGRGKCRPGASLEIAFSNPARLGDIKRAIQITPPVALSWPDWWQDDESFAWVSLDGAFAPETTYQVQLSPQLSDDYGQKLQQTGPLTFTIGSFAPEVAFGIEGTVLPSSQVKGFEIGTLNAGSVQLVTAVLDPRALLALEPDGLGVFDALSALPQQRTQTLPSGAQNQMMRRAINFADYLSASGGLGVLGIGVRHAAAGMRDMGDARLVNVTDLGLTAKLSRFGSLVWVTDLGTGHPVANAEVEIVGKRPPISANYHTDAAGTVQIPAAALPLELDDYSTEQDTLIVARSGKDWTFRAVRDFISPWRVDVRMDLSRKEHEYGLLFSERGLYRPGDTVQVKGILRAEARVGNALPKRKRFAVTLRSPNGDEVARQTVDLSQYGSFATSFRVPPTAELGEWAIKTEGLTGWANTDIRVAEYRPAEFKVAVESPQKSVLRDGEAQFEVRGDYLFGAPMVGADVSYSITREVAYFAPPGSDGFVVDDGAYHQDRDQRRMDGSVLERQSAKLDGRGKLAIRRKLSLPDQTGPERLFVEAEVSDFSRQQQAGSTALLVHPASFYLGLQTPQDWFVDAPGQVVQRVAVFAPDGRRLAGKRVDLSLIRRRWTVVREQTADGVQTRSRLVDEPVSQCNLVSAVELTSCSLPVKEGGYYVVFAKSKDEQGRTAQAAQTVYAIGPGRVSWGDDSAQRLDLTLNKKQYKVGDVARVLVKSPYQEAEALVTVERAGVHRFERVQLRGSTPTIDVPITADMEPNAFVGVHLIKSAAATGPDASPAKRAVTAPSYRLGYAEIRVDPEARRLAVQVSTNQQEFRPGADVQVTLQVKDRNGQGHAAEVTFFAVDEGVLSLIGYKTPDPLPVFTAARPLQVATLETRDDLAKIGLRDLTQLLGSNKGMEGGGGGDARKDFRQSAYFNPRVLTDAKGHATLSFKLPDSLTTYRLMAVAVTMNDRYGFGESRVTTNKPLMLRPALPRFLRSGDRFEASLIVSTKGMKPGPVTVSAEVSGITLTGPSTQVVQLDADGSAEVRFPATAHAIGKARFRFTAKTPNASDSVEVARETQSPAKEETVALYGQTTTARGEALGDFSSLRPDQGGLAITLASSALVGLDASVEQLVEFPYACTEQLASRTLPLLPLRALAKRYGLKLPDGADALAQRALAEILRRQRGDGGFALWPDSEASHPWASTYALWVLHMAQKIGKASIANAVFERGEAYLRRRVGEQGYGITPGEAAFMVMVLAELGEPDPGYLNTLFEHRAKLPLFARALLLRAAILGKASKDVALTLQSDLEAHLALDGNRAVVQHDSQDGEAMSSRMRTHALVLWALLTMNPNLEPGPALVRTLLAARQQGTWRTTQETAFSLIALAAYAARQEKEPPSFLGRMWLGKKELWNASFQPDSPLSASTWIPMAKVAKGNANLIFEAQGDGTLYYEARLRYASKTLPTTDLDRGFFIRRTLRSVDPASLASAQSIVPEVGETKFSGGALVLADVVVVTAAPRRFVVIDDPLPAGLEAIDSQLATTAKSLDVATQPVQGAYQHAWHRRELRDDRALFFIDDMPAGMYHYRFLARATTLGQFVVPSAQVSEMYQPEVFGRTAATQVEVH